MDSARVIFMIIILQNVLDCQGISIKDQILQLLLQRSRREQESPEDLQIYVRGQASSEEFQEPFLNKATSQPTSQEGDEDFSRPVEDIMDDPPDYVAYDKPVARVIKDYYKIEQANKNKKAIIEAKLAKERELPDFPDPNYPQEDGGGPVEDPSMINMLDHAKPKRTHMYDDSMPPQQQMWKSQRNPTYTQTQKPPEPQALKYRDVIDIDDARIKEKFPTFDDLVDGTDQHGNYNYKANAANISPRAEEKPTTRPVARPHVRPATRPSSVLSEPNPQESISLQNIRDEYKRETQQLRSEFATLQKTIALYTEKVDSLTNRLDNSKNTEANQGAATDVVNQLQKTVDQLKKKIEEHEQESHITDLEIINVPETPNEILNNVVLSIAKDVGTNLELRDIVFAERKGSVDEMAALTNTQLGRPIIVRLANSHIRDQLVRSARLRQGSNTTIFVKERLTQAVKDLFNRTHQAANNHSWKFVWTKHGKIFTKKSENEPTHVINSDADIERVFGAAAGDIEDELFNFDY
ncbi:uncharacterized protein LOC126910610 isoform X3 [Spodoptera frugiperda]|uniref:Uncharacterized protein LOC126910610 isoform X3 n=1 Tax=Spodoptera frugiperda TaxID=7108 RepID=A0A9R0DUB7_SPOFR|nr:uncharacterized protein LOC126910610 isoform X3 [Spodoptera frugiperda]